MNMIYLLPNKTKSLLIAWANFLVELHTSAATLAMCANRPE